MERQEVLRAIANDTLEYIQKPVCVIYDTLRRQPVGFRYQGHLHRIEEVFYQFRLDAAHIAMGFLIRTDEHIFCLYSQQNAATEPHSSLKWVLSYRILHDRELMKWDQEERKMLSNVSLQRVVDFHGHICPDLAIGGKFCEFVQHLIKKKTMAPSGFTIISENTTSALDAIQVILGATVGNQRLLVQDFGKHTYLIFSKPFQLGWCLKLKPLQHSDEEIFQQLEQKIIREEALLDEILHYQQLLDNRVTHILTLSPQDLFSIEEVEENGPPAETTSVYQRCARCGDQVLLSRCVEKKGELFCLPCFQKIVPGCHFFGLQ